METTLITHLSQTYHREKRGLGRKRDWVENNDMSLKKLERGRIPTTIFDNHYPFKAVEKKTTITSCAKKSVVFLRIDPPFPKKTMIVYRESKKVSWKNE